jgi:hypothetical protein
LALGLPNSPDVFVAGPLSSALSERDILVRILHPKATAAPPLKLWNRSSDAATRYLGNSDREAYGPNTMVVGWATPFEIVAMGAPV